MTFAPAAAHAANEAATLLPAGAMRLGPAREGGLLAEVLASQFRGQDHAVTLRLAGTPHEIRLASPVRLVPGERLGLTIDPDRLRWFPAAA